MSVRIMALVFSCDMPELKTDDGKTVPDSTAKFVLLALADHSNDEGEGAYPGVDKLCKKTNFSTSTVCNALNSLRTNGFITLTGKSKSDTNNYTLSVDRICEFQPPKSEDSSHRNPATLATETKPSFNHPLTTHSASVQEVVEQSNKKVDAILGFELQPKNAFPFREKFPEPNRVLLDAFYECKPIPLLKRDISDWLMTSNEWIDVGATSHDVKDAYKRSLPDPVTGRGGFAVIRPGSLTATIQSVVAERRKSPASDNSEESRLERTQKWLKDYREKNG